MTSEPAPRNASNPTATAVTVIGLGPMGRALAGALMTTGQRVTVWNRTPGKADDLAARGAVLAGSPAEALGQAQMAVLCVVDDDAVASVVEQAAGSANLKGLTLVNLTADSPARTRTLADQLGTHGITLLDGAIMTPAAAIGTEATRILYSGPRQAYDEHRDLLAAFGGSAYYLGDGVAAAAIYDVALLSLFWTSIAGLTQALALTRAEGLQPEEFTPHAAAMSQLVTDLLPGLAADFAAERYSGSNSATIDSLAASLNHLRSAFTHSGVTTDVLDAISSVVENAVHAGYGADAPIRLADTLQR
ncbi:NAD(P)-dependent oxidoreductase [Ornithinimicrobium murale]|uniref:NAD(P)-dependent oxidoreductase n=1 Tax=Ornithinimicrobium murale TaxID=1050153 RepID=UPI000E0D1EFF|nr:NAD(P)-binding domain-containing protein [Ornithinimicrobium murale]